MVLLLVLAVPFIPLALQGRSVYFKGKYIPFFSQTPKIYGKDHRISLGRMIQQHPNSPAGMGDVT